MTVTSQALSIFILTNFTPRQLEVLLKKKVPRRFIKRLIILSFHKITTRSKIITTFFLPEWWRSHECLKSIENPILLSGGSLFHRMGGIL